MTIKTLLLVGALSLAAASGVQAGGHSTSGDFRGHANAPACDTDRCPVLAGGPSGIGGDIRTSLIDKTRSGQIPGLWRPVLAGDGPVGAGDNNGRTAALSQGGGEFRVAASRPGMSGDF